MDGRKANTTLMYIKLKNAHLELNVKKKIALFITMNKTKGIIF